MDSGELQETPSGPDRKPVLIILHQEHSTPGHVGSLLLASGHSLDIRRPRYGEPLPQTLEGHAGTVIFGGPMSANDSDDYLRAEIALIEIALKEQSPFLGICLGAQMMAICLGAEVKTDPDGHVEIGYHDVEPLETANLGGPWPRRFYQWHREGFDLPAGSVPLATARGRFPNQALKYGTAAIGLQFHPEITYAMAARWSGRNDHRLNLLPGAMPREAQLAEHILQGPVVRGWLSRFLEHWLASSPARSIAATAAPAVSRPRT
jgi:GMP synthase (glutamine-hydrolysing)